ncbi:hypothetical protein GQR36_26330 [Enterococcus termitis]
MEKIKKYILLGMFVFTGAVCLFQNDSKISYGADEPESYDYEAPSIINSDDPSTRKAIASRSIESQNISIKYLLIKIKDTSSESLPFPDSEYRIWYTRNVNGINKIFIIHEGVTNNRGEINDVILQNIPSDVTTLNIRMIMGKSTRGYVQNTSNKTYGVVYSLKVPTDRTIDINTSSTFGVTAEQKFYAFLSAKINYYFYDSQRELKDIVDFAKGIDESNIELKYSEPINIIFEKGFETNKGSYYKGSGHNNSNIPEIVIADQVATKDQPEIFKTANIKHNILHEWLHYHMGKNADIQAGAYIGHYGYNSDFRISYKEGICLLLEICMHTIIIILMQAMKRLFNVCQKQKDVQQTQQYI